MKNKELKILLSSGCRVKVLRYFFKNPESKVYVRELASILGEYMSNVRTELIKMNEVGLLKKKDNGYRVFYSLKKSEKSQDVAKIFGYYLSFKKK